MCKTLANPPVFGKGRVHIKLERPWQVLEWKISKDPIPYPDAMAAMELRVADILAGRASEQVWLLQHPPLYTAGTSAKTSDLLSAGGFPVYEAGRGGEYTYHGPGQLIAYVMLDLKQRGAQDVRAYVQSLERWIIATLAHFHVAGEIRDGRVGVWVDEGSRESKIAALGIRIRKWVTYHGISINVNPDLSHYAGIIPCGIREHGVTSLAALGITATMGEVQEILRAEFNAIF